MTGIHESSVKRKSEVLESSENAREHNEERVEAVHQCVFAELD